MRLTDGFITQKVKKAMSEMAARDLVPAKEKGWEDEMDARKWSGKGLLQWSAVITVQGWRTWDRHENDFLKQGRKQSGE